MTNGQSNTAGETEMLEMVTQIVAAYVSNNPIPVSQIPEVVGSVHGSLLRISQNNHEPARAAFKPAVSVRKSITPDYIICLEDGKKLKMLKRHLRTTYNMSPEEYREKWNLPLDYPMVAPNYARQRSEFARKIGLGRKF